MLDKDQIAAASRILVQHWRDGSKFDALEAPLRPHSRDEAYAVHAVLENQSLGKLFGWKIAATSEAGQKHINVAGPLAGRIMSDTVIADGGTAAMKGNAMRVGEPEFCFRMGRDLTPRSSPFGVDEVIAAADTLHPAIEIPDSRFTDFTSAGEAQLIADNACAHLFVLGPATSANWRAMDLVEERPVITLRGERYVGHGKNVLGDPLMALTWLANELRGLGITLRAGQVVTTGTCHPPLPIKAGDHFAADFGALGKVSVGFA